MLLLLGWSKQESWKAFLSTKTFLYPSCSKRCIRRPRQRREFSLPHSFSIFSTTDHPYVFCILTLSYCCGCLPSLLDVSHCHSIMCPCLLHRGAGVGYALGNRAPQIDFVQIPSAEQHGLENRDRMHPFRPLQWPRAAVQTDRWYLKVPLRGVQSWASGLNHNSKILNTGHLQSKLQVKKWDKLEVSNIKYSDGSWKRQPGSYSL